MESMIIVFGSVTVRQHQLAQALEHSRAHVARSRQEPGCLSHAVYEDPETTGRLVFVEEWSDQAALDAHFRVPASIEFVGAISELAVEPPTISIFSAEKVGP